MLSESSSNLQLTSSDKMTCMEAWNFEFFKMLCISSDSLSQHLNQDPQLFDTHQKRLDLK